MTDINNSPSGHRLPLLVGDVVHLSDGTSSSIYYSDGTFGKVDTPKGYVWLRLENGEIAGWEAKGDYTGPSIAEILGGALR